MNNNDNKKRQIKNRIDGLNIKIADYQSKITDLQKQKNDYQKKLNTL